MSLGTPEMYGAAGDGVTDDFLAIKKAFLSHSVIQFGAKTYAVRGMLGVPSHRTIRGVGKDRTIIKLMDNSPYGYHETCYVFQNTFFKDDVKWIKDAYTGTGGPNGYVLGSGSVNSYGYFSATDVYVRDQAPDSPIYNQPQIYPDGNLIPNKWSIGMGYLPYQGAAALRRNVVIKDMTIDCNFNKQAKHKSYNWQGNPDFTTHAYIPELSWSVRTTTSAIFLYGEDITVENVKVINYGYGVAHLATAGSTIDWVTEGRVPSYKESFPININGSLTSETFFSDEYIDNTNYKGEFGTSRFKNNKIINCEVLQPGNVDLMNYTANGSAFVCTNQTSFVALDGFHSSSFASGGEVYGCIANPGYNPQYVTASLWKDNSLNSWYLDGIENPSLIPAGYSTLFSWLRTANGKLTGSNGQIAISNGNIKVLKKISGSWFPNGYQYGNNRLYMHGFGAHKTSHCIGRNLAKGWYHDTYNLNAVVENNKFIDVDQGIYQATGPNSILAPALHKYYIVKNNYVKLNEHKRKDFFTGAVAGIWLANGYVVDTPSYKNWVQNNTAKKVHHDNIIIENNIIELPISSSTKLYIGGGSGVTEKSRFPFYNYNYYYGLVIDTEFSGSKYNFYRNLVVKNNKFVNFKPANYFDYTNPSYNTEVIHSICFITSSNDTFPYTNTINFYKNKIINNQLIEGNTYNSPIYPSTSSLCKYRVAIVPYSGQYVSYPLDQVSKTSLVNVNGDLKVDGTITAGTKSFLIDHPTKPGKKLQYGNLESPYHGIRHTGKSKTNKNGVKVELPDYIHKLVDKENVNVQLTPIQCNKLFYIKNIDIDNNCFYVFCDEDEEHEFFWDFTAVRKDVDKLTTEI